MRRDVMETSPEGDIKRRYLRGSSLVAQQIAGSLQYYLHNAHGDVVQRMGENGNNAPRYRYDAFGNEPDACQTDPNPWRYCGEYRDAESGEYYLRTRSYNPETGRFTSEDIAKSGTNWYAYCDGDPVQYVDPTGMYGTGADAGSSYEDWWKKTYGGGGGTTNTTTSGSTDVGDAARENIASGGANLDGTVTKKEPTLLESLGTPTDRLIKRNYGPGIYINGQGRDEYRGFPVGIKDTRAAGCGWISIYNSLIALGDYAPPSMIISELDAMNSFIVGGVFGTSPLGISEYMKNAGYETKETYYLPNMNQVDESEIDNATVTILGFWHSNGAHYVAIVPEQNVPLGNSYLVYNMNNGSTDAEDVNSINQYLAEADRQRSPIFMINIS